MSIKTKFGNAKINDKGYYVITSRKEGNNNKILHRLIFEDFYKINLPSHIIIHHEDGNKLNNEIWNLVPMTRAEHRSLHNKGNKYSLGVKHSEETLRKISQSQIGMTKKKHNLSSKIRTSASLNNTSGIFRVSLHKQKKCSKGFTWKYYYHVGKKRKCISSVDLLKLKEKVLAKGLEWIILDEEKAKASMEL